MRVVMMTTKGELIVTFDEMAALEPGLLTLAADVESGRGC